MKTYQNEIFIPNIEILGDQFYKLIEPSIYAYEEFLKQEYGRDCKFDSVVLDRKRIL